MFMDYETENCLWHKCYRKPNEIKVYLTQHSRVSFVTPVTNK